MGGKKVTRQHIFSRHEIFRRRQPRYEPKYLKLSQAPEEASSLMLPKLIIPQMCFKLETAPAREKCPNCDDKDLQFFHLYLHDEAQVCYIMLLRFNKFLQYVPEKRQMVKHKNASQSSFFTALKPQIAPNRSLRTKNATSATSCFLESRIFFFFLEPMYKMLSICVPIITFCFEMEAETLKNKKNQRTN